MSRPTQYVAIALVHRQDQWLVAKRPPGAHLGGRWEFPGGKCEPGETPVNTALRELREECGISAAIEHTLTALSHDYGDRIVHITPVVCRWEAGEPAAIASDECGWVSADELKSLDMPAINAQILRELFGR
jgi:8-oxo-dGTP diphosphatase